MKKLLALLLSYTLIFTSLSPAWAGGGREVIRATRVAVQSSAAVKITSNTAKTIERLGRNVLTAPTTYAATRLANVPRPTFVPGNLEELQSLYTGWAAWMQASAPAATPIYFSDMRDILLNPSQKKLAQLSEVQRKHLYLADYPTAALEGSLVLSEEQVANALSYYKEVIATSLGLTFDVPEVLAAITNIGLFGSSEDAKAIMDAYADIAATPLEGLVDVTTIRALLNLRAYDEIQQVIDIRLARVDNAGRPVMLPAEWTELSAYFDEAGISVNLPKDRISSTRVGALSSLPSLADDVAFYNPYNLMHDNPAVNVTKDWVQLRRDLEINALTAQVQQGLSGGAIPSLQARPAQPLQQIEGVTVSLEQPDLSLSASIPPAVTTTEPLQPAVTQPVEQATQAPARQGIAGWWQRTKDAFGRVFGKSKKAAPVSDFQREGLASEGLETTLNVRWEQMGQEYPVTFTFEDQAAKEAFYKEINLQPDEYLVFDEQTRAILIRKELTPEQRASGASPQTRGFSGVFFQGAQETPINLFKVIFARENADKFLAVSDATAALELITGNRNDLKILLSKDFKAAHPLLDNLLNAKAGESLEAAKKALLDSGKLIDTAHSIGEELRGVVSANTANPMQIEVFVDNAGIWAHKLSGLGEGTLGTMGQATTSALKLLGIDKGFLSNLPTAAGQFGPAWAPFIGAWANKYGGKAVLNLGQLLGAGGHLTAATSLGLGAFGVLSPLTAFGGMVGGIVINGVAGAILKQVNPLVISQRVPDRVTTSELTADANAYASMGGMYCYLFLPIVGGASSLLFGAEVGLGTLAAMFGIAAAAPTVANVMLRRSRIAGRAAETAPQAAAQGNGGLATWWQNSDLRKNLSFGFHSPALRKLFVTTAGAHFMGLGFNSGPGTFFKSTIENPSTAMLASFASVYLTVFLGRKLGASLMKKGVISDRALAGLSGLIGLTAGGISMLPGLDVASRTVAWATAGLGFSNWANVLQTIEMNRPENAANKAAVSTMYILARTSGMLTMVMGAFGDWLGPVLGLDPAMATVAALSLPWAAGFISAAINRKFITEDLWATVRRWFSRGNRGGANGSAAAK